MKELLKKIGVIIAIILAILAVGIVGRADYEYETFEATHTPKTRMPYWYE